MPFKVVKGVGEAGTEEVGIVIGVDESAATWARIWLNLLVINLLVGKLT
jgi:hypothetical protein